MKRWLCWLAIVAATAALLAACAGDSGDKAAPAGDEAAAQDTPVATQEAGPTGEDEEEAQDTPVATQEAGPTGEDEEEAQDTPAATQEAELAGEDDLLSLLEQSSEAQQSVETFRARMDTDMTMTGMSMSVKAEYAFRLPDEIHAEMEAGLASSEMVMTDGRIFMKVTGQDWEEMPAEDVLPIDPQSMMGMANVTEPDLELFENVKIDEGEVIDGVETVHISYEIDMEKAMAQASDILGGTFSDLLGEAGEMVDLSGNLPMEVWLGDDDKLPRRMKFHMEGKVLEQDYDMKWTMEFFDYGEPVDIPSLDEMLEKIGG